MKTILILTDYSFSAFNAARYALGFAGTFDSCTVILYNSYNYLSRSAGELAYISAGFDSLKIENKERMEDLQETLEPFQSATTLLLAISDERELHDAVMEISRDHHVDMIVAGSKNRSSLGMLLVGSRVLDLINKIDMPLLVIPSSYIYEPVMCAVLATDLEEVQKLPATLISKFTMAYRCKLLVLNVSPQAAGIDSDEINEIEKLHELFDSNHAEYHYVNDGDISKTIRDFCDEQFAGLMILIHKEHSFIHKLFYKSIESEISIHSNIPVLFLHQNPEG